MAKRNQYYGLALVLALVWGDAGHWLISPHVEAGGVRVALVWAQLLLGLVFFVWALWKAKRTGAARGGDGVASA